MSISRPDFRSRVISSFVRSDYGYSRFSEPDILLDGVRVFDGGFLMPYVTQQQQVMWFIVLAYT
jgi:hypothetical protein